MAKTKGKAESRRDELQIGARLKHARLLEGILIRELAERVGCAESMGRPSRDGGSFDCREIYDPAIVRADPVCRLLVSGHR